MVLDRIENAGIYKCLTPGIARALEVLESGRLNGVPVGKYALDGEKIFALVQEYETKPWEEGVWETHKKYIDVQYIVSGEEAMGTVPVDQMTLKEPYHPERDVMFYTGEGDQITLLEGMFAIYFPGDAHKGGLRTGEGAERVRKIVVKVGVGS